MGTIPIIITESSTKILIFLVFSLTKSKTKIEISGGINLSNIHQYADLKIDYIAIGALIHSAKFFDFSLEIN